MARPRVAVRAAFKAINDGKQVAMLVPTTVLAQQHYRTMSNRLARFPCASRCSAASAPRAAAAR
jgi:transcription-repair coupling factor (superfamily II helicase)